ncbi:hypothetical protein PMG11_09744 [Penicillium brasilianum]|uniref:Aminoglycoside phosphotransferase domain-containing protein n=1 Tax=Penicillium brasilianum TaxID=104259 RepID=A0A0F7U1P5_PENBI|nr:hypothetical protein PMG11_09744 [Penicillium brasilianum]
MTNPYETDPDRIPTTDLYADVPLYGRYCPKADDFRVDPKHVNSHTTDSLCVIRIYPADEGGRDVFALGSVIVKSSHLHAQYTEIDFSYADMNELQAIELANPVLTEVKVPEVYFTSKINGRQVLIQERIPGVGMSVAWPYLSKDQKMSYKEQARQILRQLHTIKPPEGLQARSHVTPDPNILSNGRINPLEAYILFSGTNQDPDMSFMHNDFTSSNCIVDNGTVVGLIDWEMAEFFGWKTAGEVHRQEQLRDMMFWNDLYDKGVPESETMELYNTQGMPVICSRL